jgi:hypothetical protein
MKLRFFINDTFEVLGMQYRLLHVAEAIGKAYLIRLDVPNPHIEAWTLEGLAACADDPDVRKIADPFGTGRTIHPRAADIATRDQRFKRLQDIVHYDAKRLQANPDVWERDSLRRLLKGHASLVGVTEKTLLHDLRLWMVGGQNKDALLGNYFNCGRIAEDAPGSTEITELSRNGPMTVVFAPCGEKARGRKPNCSVGTDTPRYQTFAIPQQLREQIYQIAKEHYLQDKSKTFYGASIAVLDELFSLRDEKGDPRRDENGAAILVEEGKRPSLHQIRYLLRKAIPPSKAFVDRNSAHEYENNHAPSTGSVLDDCVGPGDVYEIDATVFDMWICAKANRAKLLGKPTFYLVIDRESRLIVGFFLTLDPPSWSGAEQAILSIGCDWEAVCKRLEVPYRASDWPAQGVLPNRFFADRGDMIAYASNAICDGLSIQVTNAPALYAKGKPIVESSFRATPVVLKQDGKGHEPPVNALKRRGKKYHKDGCYTLDELARLVLRLIIRHNRRQLKGYQQSPEEILGNLSVSPIDIWNRKVAERMGVLARMPMEIMRRKLMPRDEATVKRDGIHLRGLIYEFDESEDRALKEWHTQASLSGSFGVQVQYQPDLVDVIWVLDRRDERKQHKLKLTTTSQAYAGYSFAEVQYVVARLSDKQLAADEINKRHDVAARQDVKAMSKQPYADAMAAAKGMTPGMRRSGSEAFREAEAAERRRAINSFDSNGMQYGPLGASTDPEASSEPASAPLTRADTPGSAATAAPAASDERGATSAFPSTTDPALMGAFDELLESL